MTMTSEDVYNRAFELGFPPVLVDGRDIPGTNAAWGRAVAEVPAEVLNAALDERAARVREQEEAARERAEQTRAAADEFITAADRTMFDEAEAIALRNAGPMTYGQAERLISIMEDVRDTLRTRGR